jgi:pyruvate dehydrogenase E1 component beta subunit
LRVVVPSSPARAYGLLLAAIRDPDPVIFFEPTRLYRVFRQPVDDTGEALPLDTCFTLRDGTDVTLVSWGGALQEVQAAADQLAQEGVLAEVIDVATLKPLDMETILASVAKTGRCVIVHEAARTSGFGAEIAAVLAARPRATRDGLRRGDAVAQARTPIPAQRRAHRRRGQEDTGGRLRS